MTLPADKIIERIYYEETTRVHREWEYGRRPSYGEGPATEETAKRLGLTQEEVRAALTRVSEAA